MESSEHKKMEDELREAVVRISQQLLAQLQYEPHLILEAEDEAEENEHTVNEITSWLFRRRQRDGYPDDKADNCGSAG